MQTHQQIVEYEAPHAKEGVNMRGWWHFSDHIDLRVFEGGLQFTITIHHNSTDPSSVIWIVDDN